MLVFCLLYCLFFFLLFIFKNICLAFYNEFCIFLFCSDLLVNDIKRIIINFVEIMRREIISKCIYIDIL